MHEQRMAQRLESRIAALGEQAPDSIGDMLHLGLVFWDEAEKACLLRGQTQGWMRNVAGTLHGGIGATLADQSMGLVAYALKEEPCVIATISMQVNYHRPLHPGEDVLLRVRVVSVTKSLISLSVEAAQWDQPEKTCMTGSATYFCKPIEG